MSWHCLASAVSADWQSAGAVYHGNGTQAVPRLSSAGNFHLLFPGVSPMLAAMALARIPRDGYSLLHNCPGIAPGNARHSATARDELIEWLARYQDASGTPGVRGF